MKNNKNIFRNNYSYHLMRKKKHFLNSKIIDIYLNDLNDVFPLKRFRQMLLSSLNANDRN